MEYDIFREALAIKYPAQGHALWVPGPGGLYSAVEVGDVGFVREGKFHRLFNVLLPEDHPSHKNFGVPEHYEPLELKMKMHIYPSALSPIDFRSREVTVVSDELGISAAGPEPAQVTFSCSRKRGAILSLPVQAQRNDTLAHGEFAKCILKYIDVWFAFARELGLGVTRMEDIILVTGRDLVRSWTNVAFSESKEGEQVSLGVRVTSGGDVEWQFSREDIRGVAVNRGPSGQNLPQNQCIFIRGFRVARFLKMLPRLRGAAEPTQGPSGDEPEFETKIISTPSDTDYQDPLHTLLDYLTTQAPDCDVALVHDDDLRYIDVVVCLFIY
ncbi:hypothetical protein BJV78DRAFT_1232159 [Lactifluus subvellereus]|nr:hypothetical protein BJV78DRAFT_1232159 [Lactifluus subvellereus]